MRRAFFAIILFIWSFAALAAGLPIIQGVTGERETVVAILSDAPLGSVVLTEASGKTHASSWIETAMKTDATPFVRTFYFSDLAKGGTFTLVVRNVEGKVIDQRTLRTLDLSRPQARIAVASCMDDSWAEEQGAMWRELLGHKPDVLFLIGDNVYGDRRGRGKSHEKFTASASVLWERYVETRRTLDLFRAKELVPVYATWDDHDYGVNNAGRHHPFRAESERIFKTFFPRPEITGVHETGPGVSAIFHAFDQRFIFLDDRSFRSGPTDADQAHFGPTQEQWLSQKVAEESKPTWLLNGDQFFGGYHEYESYEGTHPKAFQTFASWLRTIKSPIFFVSGDRHLTELMKISEKEIGQEAYELTSSGIHVRTFPNAWGKTKNPRQIAGASGVLNYAIIETAQNPRWKLDVSAFGPRNKLLFHNELFPPGPKN